MAKPIGKYQKAMFNFLKRNPGWNSFSEDKVTKNTTNSLQKKGLICVSKKTKQIKLKKGNKC